MPAVQVVNLLGVEGSLVETTPNSERWLESTEKPIEVVREGCPLVVETF